MSIQSYYRIKTNPITFVLNKHTADDPSQVSRDAWEALDHIGSTPWRINQYILSVVRQALEHPLQPGLKNTHIQELDETVDDEVWDSMTHQERAEIKRVRSEKHAENARARNAGCSMYRTLMEAEVLGTDAFYVPHMMDFRTRIYPQGMTINPQGSSMDKGLLEFAHGLPLGERGLYWLAVKVATCAGHDKLAFDDRVQWTSENLELIRDCVMDPMGNQWWASDDVDDPWGLLASGHEYICALDSKNPLDYESHQPVPFDATCSGIQILSMLGRDPVGAKATNVSANAQRQDIYADVAKKVQASVKADMNREDAQVREMATYWLAEGITRSTVKRAVMTTPYGVTDRGITDQLVKDGHAKHFTAANYLKEHIKQGLAGTVVKGVEIMAYFQETAKALAKAKQPLVWQTPMGSQCTQAYKKDRYCKIKTVVGEGKKDKYLYDPQEIDELDPSKQGLASAPNVIHSFDATLLQLTVLMLRDCGVDSMQMIHDSFAVHPSNADLLCRSVRKAAVDIFSHDWLEEFDQFIRGYAEPDVELPELPERGAFDVTQVLDSQFFFS